jgi:hypothetical protein
MQLTRGTLRYQVAKLAEDEIAKQARAAGVELGGRRDEAVLAAVAGLMDGKRPNGSDPVSRLAVQAQDAILARARKPGHGDLVLDLLLSHRFKRHLESTLPTHTIQILQGFRRVHRKGHRRRGWR